MRKEDWFPFHCSGHWHIWFAQRLLAQLCILAHPSLYCGYGFGRWPCALYWFIEFVPAAKRGTWMVVFHVSWTVGTVLEALLAWAVMPVLGWRWLLALSSAPCIVLLIFFPLTPESPKYLCSRGRTIDATVILERIARVNKGTLPPGILIYTPEKHVDSNHGTSESALLIAEDNAGIEEDKSSMTSDVLTFQALWSYDLIRLTFLLCFIYLANYFAYYGVILLTSKLSNGGRACASSRTHLMQPNSGNLYRDVLVTSLAEFPGLLLAGLLVDRIGRKTSMGGMLMMCGAFLAPLSGQLGEGLVTTLLFCARTCIMGSFAVLYVYTPELYPASSRNTGVGITSSLGRIGSIISPLIVVGLLESCRQKETVIVMDLALFLAGVTCASSLERPRAAKSNEIGLHRSIWMDAHASIHLRSHLGTTATATRPLAQSLTSSSPPPCGPRHRSPRHPLPLTFRRRGHGLPPLPHRCRPPHSAKQGPQRRHHRRHARCSGSCSSGQPDSHGQGHWPASPAPRPLRPSLGLPLPSRRVRPRLRRAPHRRGIPYRGRRRAPPPRRRPPEDQHPRPQVHRRLRVRNCWRSTESSQSPN
ncbi:hypothetical protein BS78_02G321600 [Paspalum vaginatum]|nr:hypothetical protein BS78_02G321600 [Paspalum vaginatum]